MSNGVPCFTGWRELELGERAFRRDTMSEVKAAGWVSIAAEDEGTSDILPI